GRLYFPRRERALRWSKEGPRGQYEYGQAERTAYSKRLQAPAATRPLGDLFRRGDHDWHRDFLRPAFPRRGAAPAERVREADDFLLFAVFQQRCDFRDKQLERAELDYARIIKLSPEANRQKGTLQVKVQIKNPD